MTADFQIVTTVNIYTPPGVEMRDRGNLFSYELPHQLRGIPPSFLIGGDLNSVLTTLDATAHTKYTRALQEFIRGFDLVDMWETSRERATYIHYTSGEPRGLIGYTRLAT
jgi:hypothetical protein